MSQTQEECVLKRNGSTETVSFDKILKRIKTLGDEAGGLSLNYTTLCRKIIDQLYNKIPTSEIDELTAQQCASMQTLHPDYEVLAARILVSNHQKNTDSCFLEVVEKLYNFPEVSKRFQMHPSASECIPAGPNGSEWVRTRPKALKNSRKLRKTSRNRKNLELSLIHI